MSGSNRDLTKLEAEPVSEDGGGATPPSGRDMSSQRYP